MSLLFNWSKTNMKIVNVDHLVAYIYKRWPTQMAKYFGTKGDGTERNTLVYINGIYEENTAQQLFSFEARLNLEPNDYFELFSNAKIIYIGYTKTDYKL